MTTTVGDTEPPPSQQETEEREPELAQPAPSTAPSTTIEPTDLDAGPDKDRAETTPVEDTDEGDDNDADNDATNADETPGSTVGEGDNDGPDDGSDDGGDSGGVNDPDLSGLDEHAQASVTYVNGRRGESGLNQLTVDPDLTAMADDWARQMIAQQDLHHNPNLGDERPDRFGLVGENIAFSFDPTNIDDMWWNSDGHRENIMGANYTHIGVAFVRDADGTTWAVQVFGG